MSSKPQHNAWRLLAVMLTVGFLAAVPNCRTAFGDEAEKSEAFAEVNVEWGGHLRGIGTTSWLDEDSVYQFVADDPYFDGQLEGRLKNRIDFGRRWSMETHYEMVALGGDVYENTRDLEVLAPTLYEFSVGEQVVDDDRRLLDLTHVLTEKDRYLTYHRLDRLNVSYSADWGTLRLGRQALTWGDGLIFNPMDLFNAFSPTAVQRDYKVGDDMAHLQLPFNTGELQMLYLPRRDPATGDVEEDVASYAAKYHTFVGAMEMDVMAARHYADTIAGLGASGYWGGAAWRINTVYTYLDEGDGRNDILQAVANLDYAWIWGGKNYYGLVEFFYNSLGYTDDYERVLDDTDLLDRLSRGELFSVGRYYLSGQVQIELHPLLQFYTTAIVNLCDPSGVLQPQLVWDVTEDFQAIFGAQWHWGGCGSEYGGYEVATAETTVRLAPADRVYLWLTYYF